MNTSRLLTLTVGCTLLGGGSAALAQAPVAMNDGTTITGANEFIGDELVYPSGCPVVYETFNDTYPPNYGTGWTVSDGRVGCWGPAHKFVADNDYALCQVLVSATHVVGTNQYRVRLHLDDAGGDVPGTEMRAWEFFDIPQNQAGPTPLLEADATGLSFANGQSYWLSIIASSGNSDSWGVLRWSSHPNYSSVTGANWACTQWNPMAPRNAGAWRVTGNVGGGGFTIRLSGSCPGQKTLSWAGAGSGQMGILIANGSGNCVIPGGPCSGTQLGLGCAGLSLYNVIGTQGGQGQVSTTVGTQACGKWVQCIKTNDCATSNAAGPI